MKTIYFAGGCFWGVEAFFQRIKGVVNTRVGYANGDIENPSYEDLKYKRATHAETVKVDYDENIISLEKLLSYYFSIIDPYAVNRQANDIGLQYRTGVFYLDKNDEIKIRNYFNTLDNHENFKIIIEELKNFYDAEEYHQNYLKKNPHGYCHIDLSEVKDEN